MQTSVGQTVPKDGERGDKRLLTRYTESTVSFTVSVVCHCMNMSVPIVDVSR